MPSAFLLIDIFDDISSFRDFLKNQEAVKKIYPVMFSIKHYSKDGAERLYDKEFILELSSASREGLEDIIRRITSYSGVRFPEPLYLRK